MAGGAAPPPCRFRNTVTILTRPPADAGYLCVPPTLRILKEVVSSYVPEEEDGDRENPEDPTAVVLGVVANLFQKVIELLARRLRRQPEEGKQVFDGCLNRPQIRDLCRR